jgi:hypothetical protein
MGQTDAERIISVALLSAGDKEKQQPEKGRTRQGKARQDKAE